MTHHGTRMIGVLFGITTVAALGSGRMGYGDDQPTPARCKALLNPTELEPIVKGASRCGDCHSLGKPPESQDLQPLCRCNERTFWEHNDKHQDAYAVLDGERARRINALRRASTPPQKDLDCLGCHSMASAADLAKGKIDSPVLAQGVSCIACHGAYDNWIDIHGTANDDKRICWRRLSREEKEKNWGMKDLWDPVKRTQVCASCHIGDPDPGVHRFVTHDMYAAGHPPLPAFQTAAFCNSLPRHWQLMNEKPPKMQEQDYRWNRKELEQTKVAVVGEAAAFRAAVSLLAGKAEQTPADQALDYALFDCSACHHDLKQPSWRQTAGYEGPPGRPGVRRWSPAGLDLCLWYADGTEVGGGKLRDAFEARMGDLRAAFTSRPFGDAGKVRDAGKALVQWADAELLPRLTSTAAGDGIAVRYDRKAALALLKHLAQDAANPGRGKTPDYDGARQTAWTFRAVYDDLSWALKESKDDADAARAWQALQDKQAAIQVQFDRLDRALNLTLPNAQGVSEEDYTRDPKAAQRRRLGQIEAFLPLVLKQEADYDPKAVRDAFAELAKLLP